jgi:hypothetical protein
MRIVVNYGYDTDSREFYCPASDDDGDAIAAPLAAGHATEDATAERAAAGDVWLFTINGSDHGGLFRLTDAIEHTLENIANRTAAEAGSRRQE